MTITRLLIARHGNTFGPGDIVTRVGTTDLPLSESGLEQGRLLGAYLKQEKSVPDVIFTSQLRRTKQTAEQAQQVMGTALAPLALQLFNEIDYGPDENKPEDEVVKRLGIDAIKAWDEEAIVPDGWRVNSKKITQDWKDFAADIRKKHAGQTILVVTSNGIARFAPTLTGDISAFLTQHKLKIATGALCVLENDGSALWQCREWNLKPKERLQNKP